MSAVVTLKLDPAEYDLVRQSLRDSAENARLDGRDPETSSALRKSHREYEARVRALLAKIG